MNSAYTTTTYVGSFTSGSEVCTFDHSTTLNTGSINSDGDIELDSDTDSNNNIGAVTAFAWKKMYFTSGTDIDITAIATVNVDANDGYSHIVAYIAPSSIMYYISLLGCITNGSAVGGQSGTATIVSLGPNDSETGLEVGTSSLTIPSSGYYNVVIYGDAQTQTNGEPTQTDFDNPIIRLVY